MKKLIIVVPFVIALIFLIIRSNSDELRIRKNLAALEKLLTKSPDESPAAGLGRARKVGAFFTDDCSVTLSSPAPDIAGSGELAAIVHRARQEVHKIKVQFADISISVPDRNNAELTLTATAVIYEPGSLKGEVEAREVELTLVKLDGLWKIKKVIDIETLR